MDLNALIEEIYTLEKRADEYKEAQKAVNEKLAVLEKQAIETLKDLNLTSVKHARGTLFMTARFSVKNPATPEDREAFYGYLKQKQIFEDMVSVNSQRLNAWYKEEMEAAKTAGDFGFKVPGIGEPTAYEYITLKGMK